MDTEVRDGQLSARARTHPSVPPPRAQPEVRPETTEYIMILRVQVMFYTLDRVTCEETIVDKFLLLVGSPAARRPVLRPPTFAQALPTFYVASPPVRSGCFEGPTDNCLPIHM